MYNPNPSKKRGVVKAVEAVGYVAIVPVVVGIITVKCIASLAQGVNKYISRRVGILPNLENS